MTTHTYKLISMEYGEHVIHCAYRDRAVGAAGCWSAVLIGKLL